MDVSPTLTNTGTYHPYIKPTRSQILKNSQKLPTYPLTLAFAKLKNTKMLARALAFIIFLTSLLAVTGATPVEKRYFPQGTISNPANGTVIMPGQTFDFLYNPRGDYCLSSYNITVWLLTSPPSSVLAGTATGHYFGRYAYSSYPSSYFPEICLHLNLLADPRLFTSESKPD